MIGCGFGGKHTNKVQDSQGGGCAGSEQRLEGVSENDAEECDGSSRREIDGKCGKAASAETVTCSAWYSVCAGTQLQAGCQTERQGGAQQQHERDNRRKWE
jgi:hypothetical protein